jgi:DNA invertase Pin-like site-specific DNA recombinase
VKVAAYVRVSTDKQAERGLGLDVQEQAIRAWGKTNGHKLGTIHRDEGVSGSNGLDTRVGLQDALEALRAKTAGGLVVYRLDRLARDLIIQEQILAEVRRLGALVFSTSAAEAGYLDDDPDDPSRKLIRQVLGSVAEYERAMTVLRLKAGRRRKAEQGGFAYGSPPMGYRADDGKLVPVESEQAAVRRALELQATGESIRGITAALNAEGYHSKRGGAWHPTTVARLLRPRA